VPSTWGYGAFATSILPGDRHFVAYRTGVRGGLLADVGQILDAEENLTVLARLVEHFEHRVEEPMLLDTEWGRPVAEGTVGIRLPISRFVCKIKMSQDKDPVSQRQVIAALRAPGPYHHPALADDMERALTQE
jgi:transcriptional regulator